MRSTTGGRSIHSVLPQTSAKALDILQRDGCANCRFPLSTFSAQQKYPPNRSRIVCAAELDTEKELQIENMNRIFCDDFVCTSSPAVEQTIRTLTRDIIRQTTWTQSVLSKDVKYSDPLRSFTGASKYSRLHFITQTIGNPRVELKRIYMKDKGQGVIEWELSGKVLAFDFTADFQSEFILNLLTGRVVEHRENWSLARSSPQARVAFLALRAAWSAKQKSQDMREGGSKLARGSKQQDDAQGAFYEDPTDPTKFFQQQDNTFNDALAFGTLLAILYLFSQAYGQLDKMK